MNILITCAGRRHYLVEFFKDFVGSTGSIIGTDMSPYAPALAACDKSILCHSVSHPDYINQLIEICLTEKINYIFSVNDLELALLAENKEIIKQKSGAIAVVSNRDAIEIAADKYKTHEFFEQCGIPSPKTYISLGEAKEALKKDTIHFPLIIKPRWGSASISIIKVSAASELDSAYQTCIEAVKNSILNHFSPDNSVIIQEFIEGQEYGIDILNSLNSEYIGYCSKKKLAMRSGETDKSTPIKDERFDDPVKKIAQTLKHIGNLDCDVLERDGKLYFLELNPRFGGGYPFTHYAGANHISLLLTADSVTNKSKAYKYNTDYTYTKCDTIVKFPNQ
ncbi:ATP-grasp domain-containing protein [Kerstersia similis]|uniref:ATP-grasp domain-containing protein n=1 Tax=Kerstersia similis TaxID=206505 RepID=UPI0039F05371